MRGECGSKFLKSRTALPFISLSSVFLISIFLCFCMPGFLSNEPVFCASTYSSSMATDMHCQKELMGSWLVKKFTCQIACEMRVTLTTMGGGQKTD